MIEEGKKVTIHYKLEVEGETVDSSEGREPFTFIQGEGQIIPGLEKELEGHAVGDKVEAEIPPAEAYGEYDQAAVQSVPKSAFASTDELNVGDVVKGQGQQGSFQARVAEIKDEEVTLDLNHPLAGKTLEFKVEVVGVE